MFIVILLFLCTTAFYVRSLSYVPTLHMLCPSYVLFLLNILQLLISNGFLYLPAVFQLILQPIQCVKCVYRCQIPHIDFYQFFDDILILHRIKK